MLQDCIPYSLHLAPLWTIIDCQKIKRPPVLTGPTVYRICIVLNCYYFSCPINQSFNERDIFSWKESA